MGKSVLARSLRLMGSISRDRQTQYVSRVRAPPVSRDFSNSLTGKDMQGQAAHAAKLSPATEGLPELSDGTEQELLWTPRPNEERFPISAEMLSTALRENTFACNI